MNKKKFVIYMVFLMAILLCITYKINPFGGLHRNGSHVQTKSHAKATIPKNTQVSTNQPVHDFRNSAVSSDLNEKPGWQLVWNDEFNDNSINDKYWTLQNGGGIWGNNELQYYTDRDKNSFVSDGKLTIRSLKEDYESYQYTSARIVTKNKLDFLYGRFDIKAKLPNGKGLFPAIWLLPSNNNYNSYLKNGEIDLVEMLGNDPHFIYGVAHYSNQNQTRSFRKYNNGADFSENFHIYSIEWDLNEIKWLIDNELYYTMDLKSNFNESYNPFNKKFYLIINLAIGGDWPGNDFSNTTFPALMEIDYVRYYKIK